MATVTRGANRVLALILVGASACFALGALGGCSSEIRYMSASGGSGAPVVSAPGEAPAGTARGPSPVSAAVPDRAAARADDDDRPGESFLPDDLAPVHILDRPKGTSPTSSELSRCEGVIASVQSCLTTATMDPDSQAKLLQFLAQMHTAVRAAESDPVKRAMLAARCEDAQQNIDTVRAKLRCSAKGAASDG